MIDTTEQLYTKVSFILSKIVTTRYSTSFSLGVRALSKKYQDAIFGIYGFVRVADEIVDTFKNVNKEKLFNEFRLQTYQAIDEGISTNPILHSFQLVVNHYKIDKSLIDAFLNSMQMDLYYANHDRNRYDQYIFGSAEAVGLMCLKVFVDGNQEMYEKLKPYARALGSAFQKVNFLRDIKSDFEERGRLYFPDIQSENELTNQNKQKLEQEVEKEFSEAIIGIKQLSNDVKLGVYSAFKYYEALFKKIKKSDIETLRQKRIRVPNFNKICLLVYSYLKVKILKTI